MNGITTRIHRISICMMLLVGLMLIVSINPRGASMFSHDDRLILGDVLRQDI